MPSPGSPIGRSRATPTAWGFALRPLFAALINQGLQVRLSDCRRVATVLRADGPWTLAQLRRVLSALLVRKPGEEAILEHALAAFFDGRERPVLTEPIASASPELPPTASQESTAKPELEPAPEPGGEPSPKKQQRRPWLKLVAGIGCVLVTVLMFNWPHPEAPTDFIRVTQPSRFEPPLLSRRYTELPTVKVIPLSDLSDLVEPPSASAWELMTSSPPLSYLLALLVIALIQCSGVKIYRWYRDRARLWRHDLPASIFHPGLIGGPLRPWLDARTLDHLAQSLRYVQDQRRNGELNLAATVELTGRRGGFPGLIYRPGRRLHQVLIVAEEDAGTGFNPVRDELANGLRERGIQVVSARFAGHPERIWRDGVEQRLDDLAGEREACLLLIFSDGRCLAERDRAFLADLARWPAVIWLETRERRAWDGHTALLRSAGLAVHPATCAGLMNAFEHLCKADGEAPREALLLPHPHRPTHLPDEQLELWLGDAYPWAQACSLMVPPLGLALADALRRRFFPDLPAERIGRLLELPATDVTHEGLQLASEVRAALRRALVRRQSANTQRAMVAFLLSELEQVEPEAKGSPAHQAWEWRYQRLRLELDPEPALRRLELLLQGPFGRRIRRELQVLEGLDAPQVKSSDRIELLTSPSSWAGRQRLRRLASSTTAVQIRMVLGALSPLLTLGCVLLLVQVIWAQISWPEGNPGTPFVRLTVELPWAARMHFQIRTSGGWDSLLQQYMRLSGAARQQVRVWPIVPEATYRLSFLADGAIHTEELGPFASATEIHVTWHPGKKSCSEDLEPGLRVQRCSAQPQNGLNILEQRKVYAPQFALGRELSLGLVIAQGAKSTSPAGETLLESGLIDALYHIDLNQLQTAFDAFQGETELWAPHTLLLWWCETAVSTQGLETLSSGINVDIPIALGCGPSVGTDRLAALARHDSAAMVVMADLVFNRGRSSITTDAEADPDTLGDPATPPAMGTALDATPPADTSQPSIGSPSDSPPSTLPGPTLMPTLTMTRWPHSLPFAGTVETLAFDPSNPSGYRLAIGGGTRNRGVVEVWRDDGEKERPSDLEHIVLEHTMLKRAVQALAFSANGRWLAAVGDHGTLALWRRDSDTWEPVSPPRKVGSKDLHSLAFADDDLFLGDSAGKIYRLHPGDDVFETFLRRSDDVRALASARYGLWLLAADLGGGVGLWNTESRTKRADCLLSSGLERLLVGHNDGWIAVADDASRLWSLPLATADDIWCNRAREARAHAPITALTLKPVGGIVIMTGHRDGTVTCWGTPPSFRTSSCRSLYPSGSDEPAAKNGLGLKLHDDEIRALAFSRDAALLASASKDGMVKIWRLERW